MNIPIFHTSQNYVFNNSSMIKCLLNVTWICVQRFRNIIYFCAFNFLSKMGIFNLPVWYLYFLIYYKYFHTSTKKLLTKRNSFFLFSRKHRGLRILYISFSQLSRFRCFFHSFSRGIFLPKKKSQKEEGASRLKSIAYGSAPVTRSLMSAVTFES